MRQFFVENDLISAEVQKVMSDRSVALHTRSFKYGTGKKEGMVSFERSDGFVHFGGKGRRSA